MRLVHKEVRLTLLEVCVSHLYCFVWAIIMLGMVSGMLQWVFRVRESSAVMWAAAIVTGDQLLGLVIVLPSSDQPIMFVLTQVAFVLLACERFLTIYLPHEDRQHYR